MSKAIITPGQALNLGASFLVDTPWEDLEVNIQPFIELPPSKRGEIFADFLKDLCEKFMLISITKPFIAKFVDDGWSIWKGPADGDGFSGDEVQDQRALDLTKIELKELVFKSCLKEDEDSITGEEKLRRLQEKQDFIPLGANAFLALWEDYQAKKEDSFLEKIHEEYGITYLDFPSTILRNPNGNRNVLYLFCNDDGQWDWSCSWLDGGWDADDLSAGCASN